MDALRHLWHGGRWRRPWPRTGHNFDRDSHGGGGRARSMLREALHVVGLVLYTVLAVNALILLELVPGLGPGSPSTSSSHSHHSHATGFPSTASSSGQEPRAPRSRLARRVRKRSSDDAARMIPAALRPTLPAGPPAPSTAASSLLLSRLPLELRHEIYRHVLAGRHKQFIRLGSDDAPHAADFRLGGAAYRTRDSFVTAPWSAAYARSGSGRNGHGYGHGHGQLLALSLVCRQVYTESIALLYQAVVFKACRLVTVADLSRALAPAGHLANIRALELAYEFRCGLPLRRSVALVEDADWKTAWRVIATQMPGLRRLRVDLFAFDAVPLVQSDDDVLVSFAEEPECWRWLKHMLQPRGLKQAHVKLHAIRRLSDVPWERPMKPVRWFMLVVMEALERVCEATWMGKRLDPTMPPFTIPRGGAQGSLLDLLEACCRMQRQMLVEMQTDEPDTEQKHVVKYVETR